MILSSIVAWRYILKQYFKTLAQMCKSPYYIAGIPPESWTSVKEFVAMFPKQHTNWHAGSFYLDIWGVCKTQQVENWTEYLFCPHQAVSPTISLIHSVINGVTIHLSQKSGFIFDDFFSLNLSFPISIQSRSLIILYHRYIFIHPSLFSLSLF